MKSQTYISGISSRRWLQLRRAKLTDQPLCEECERNGYVVAATEVHHIVPVESVKGDSEQLALLFKYSNLMSVCHSCHVAIHQRIGKNTKEDNTRRQKAEVESFARRFLSPGGTFKNGG